MATTKAVKKKARRLPEKPAPAGSSAGPETMEAGRNPFWDFSLAVYARDGTAPACLALQDTKGLDVNLLLFCCWAGATGRSLQRSELETLVETVKPWRRDVIEPLRHLRRKLGAGGDFDGASNALLKQLKSAELESEAVQQRILFELISLEAGESSVQVAAQNLKAYVELSGVQCDSAVTADLAAVLRGAFPTLAPLEAVWTLV